MGTIEISINDANGNEPLPICRGNREYILDCYHGSIEMIALRYFTDEYFMVGEREQKERKSIKHLRECPRCKEWFHMTVPDTVIERQHRLSKYCCAGMYTAIEESERYNVPVIKFSLFRGEDPCWMIENKNAFISYCPWCGKKMPNRPFIDE